MKRQCLLYKLDGAVHKRSISVTIPWSAVLYCSSLLISVEQVEAVDGIIKVYVMYSCHWFSVSVFLGKINRNIST